MTALDVRVEQGFIAAGIPAELVKELLEAFAEAKRRFYRDDLRPSEIEGARFSEAVFRILEWATTQKYTPLGDTLPKVPTLMGRLEQATTARESVRFHIPRTLRLISTCATSGTSRTLATASTRTSRTRHWWCGNMEWVLAELVRLHHNVSATEAHGIIVDLVSKDVPLIQVFDGFPRVLKQLKASDHFLALLYWRGVEGATLDELRAWARATMRAQIRRTLNGLDGKDLIHLNGDRYVLTHLGEKDVEERKLLEPQ